MQNKLFIISNESIYYDKENFFCDNLDMKSTPEGLNKFFEVNIIARKSKKKRSHVINLKNISTHNNIFGFISSIFDSFKKKNSKYFVVSLSPFTFLACVLLVIFRKNPIVFLRSDGYEEYKSILGFLGPAIYHVMFFCTSKISRFISCGEKNLKGKKGEVVYPSQLTDKWFLDMRGFEKSAKIDDIQMQVQRTGSTANHGKITLNFYSLIVKESGGKRAVDAYQRARTKIFGKTLPSASDHMMTPPTIFNDYVNKRAGDGEFNKQTLSEDAGKWARYIQWLSKGRGMSVPTEQQVGNTEVMRMFRQKLGSTVGSTAKQMPKKAPGKRKEDWKKDKKGKHLPYEANQQDIIFASKYLKTKVQAAESGFIVDILRPTIKKEVKNNIMKSAYMYGASKGLRIFTTKGATEQLSSSTYIKVGG